ncbi:MAG: PAS domain S-box protein, partial [Anaerolineales bacterium]|nr:PAS domain S-box protein [Anaerolineales bacterium]
NDRADSTLWAVGFKPAQAPLESVNFTKLPLQSGPEGALQNEYRSFRMYIHEFMLPIAAAVLISDAFFLLGLPLLLKYNFSLPLHNLIQGVQDFNSGKRGQAIPVQINDEIGLLTSAFNFMTSELDSLISTLESRVEKRTAELVDSNRALQNSQRFFEGLFEVSPDAILTVNAQGKITRVNTRAENIFGYSRAELIDQQIETLIPDHLTASHIGKRVQYQKLPHPHEVRANREIFGRRKSGREFPVDILLSPFESIDGQLTLAVIRDISDRLEMDKALRRRNETLSALDQIMLDLINRHDVDDILHTFLEKAGSLLDTPEVSIDLAQDADTLVNYASMQGLPVQAGDRVHRNDGAMLSWQAVDTRQPVAINDYSTWEHRRPLYEGYPLHAVLIVPILQGERVLGTINFTRNKPNHPFGETDIYVAIQLAQMVALTLNNAQLYSQLRSELAERRQIEDVLRISQQNFISYFNMGTVGMCVITPEKNWVEVNDRLCKMLGYTRDELKQIHWNDLTHPNDLGAEMSLFDQTMRDEYESHQMNKRFLRKDGSVAYTSMYVSCQRHPDRSVWYFLISLVDITDRIMQEQTLQRTQAELMEQKLTSATLEERQRLARNLHDSLSQSVHSLVLFSQTLQSALEKNNFERAKRIVEQVQESARQSHKETRLLLYELQAPGKGRSVDLIHELESRLAKVENHAGIGSQIIVKGSAKDIPSAWTEDLYLMTIEALNSTTGTPAAARMRPTSCRLERWSDSVWVSSPSPPRPSMSVSPFRPRTAATAASPVMPSPSVAVYCGSSSMVSV